MDEDNIDPVAAEPEGKAKKTPGWKAKEEPESGGGYGNHAPEPPTPNQSE
ncbi:hypothetical protein [Sphingomonas bacterium]|nr:hypothetical protein [Sphingomonas bacterium]